MAQPINLWEYAGNYLPAQIVRAGDKCSEVIMLKTPYGVLSKTIESDSPWKKSWIAIAIEFIDKTVKESKQYLLEERRKTVDEKF